MQKFKIMFLILLMTITFFNTQCSKFLETEAQSQSETKAGEKPINSGFANQARVDGVVTPFNSTDNNLRTSFLNQPVPEVWLLFADKNSDISESELSDKNEIRVELPTEAKNLLKSYWETSLMCNFNTEIEKTQNADDYKENLTQLIRVASTTKNDLQKVFVKAPNETRPISYEEAGDLISFISSSAVEVTEQAKKQK